MVPRAGSRAHSRITEGTTMKHTHDAIIHTHEHAHVVHYLRHGTQ
jgi:hypothetical protein